MNSDLKPITTKELIKKTQAVEDEKLKKKAERIKRKRDQELKKRREKIEKLVAPVLLIITLIISYLATLL